MERGGQTAPKKLLEHIGWQGTETAEWTFPTASGSMHAVNEYNIGVPRMMVPIRAYYRERCRLQKRAPSGYVPEMVDLLVWELLLNAAEHGHGWDHRKSIHVTIWMGDTGILIGCRDEGEFLKQKETKRKMTNCERIHAYDEVGRGKGTRLMYRHADLIEVDMETGTIFLALYFF